MSDYWIISALVIGFMGSLHCVGMCGPLALSLPLPSGSYWLRLGGILIYNLGRILSYAIIGLVAGGLGKLAFFTGVQQWISVAAGIFILIVFFLPSKWLGRVTLFNGIFKLRSYIVGMFDRDKKTNLFLLGSLNGLLPCGLVYMAVAGSVAMADVLKGSIYMAVFGLGTLPAMIAVVHLGSFLGNNLRKNLRKAVPVFVVATALLLILRGMNLGIPYVSPKVTSENNKVHACCHKH